MKIINTTSVFPPCWDASDALRRLASLGYDGLDMAFDYCVQQKDYPFMTDGFEDWARSLKAEAAELGVSYTHSHAPFDTTARGELVERTFCCAALLGVRYMVAHPVESAPGRGRFTPEEFIEENARLIQPLIEEAERHGIILLSENINVPAKLISQFVAAVDHPNFGWCYDTGHANMNGFGLADFRSVEVPPLSLHIQDNHGNGDEHFLPGNGTIDWGEFLRSLKAVGYPGEFVLEAHHQPLDAPDDQRDGILTDLLDRARRMVAYYETL